MQLGLGTFAYAWTIGIPGYPPPRPMSAMAFVDRAAALGLRVIQIADNLPLHQMKANEINELLGRTKAFGIQVEIGTRGIAPEHLRRYLEIAQHFEAALLRIVVDTADSHPTPDEVIGALRPLMPAFEQARVILAIENHDRFKARTLARIVQEIDSPYTGICLDTVNSFGAGEGPEQVVGILGPYVVNLHIKDFSIRRHHHMLGFEVEGTPAGKGMLDVPWLLSEIHKNGCDFDAILETWPPPERDVVHTIQKEDLWVQESIQYLRTLIKE
ncbi:MAG: sugar phosphate isomerase/epimerase family protein [Anaerolineales bacterium]